MELIIDPDVKAVAEFMQREIPARRLEKAARGIAALAPLLWQHHSVEEMGEPVIRLSEPPIPISGVRNDELPADCALSG
jgi:hypothetical protein